MFKNAFYLTFFALLFTNVVLAQKIEYKIKFENPQTHYAFVEMRISELKTEEVEVVMPVWAPGSYLVREYSKNMENVEVRTDAREAVSFVRTSKNVWKIKVPKDKSFTFMYDLYANELSVRTNFIDASHAYLNPVAAFPFVKGLEDKAGTLTVVPHASWAKIHTALAKKSTDWERSFTNYDEFADSPIEIGNHDVFEFTAAGIPHTVAVYGGGNYTPEIFTQDFKRVVEEAIKVFGENPCTNYLFIVHNTLNGGGGLEHKNSTTLHAKRNAYQTPEGKIQILSLVAHEYFHLWNVKRLRPEGLGPFDYTKENYTRQLWFSEGITSYYDELLLLRAGYVKTNDFLKSTIGNMETFEKNYGKNVQSLGDASFEAWIKFYRPNENSANSTVSYYGKGATIGLLLDLEIAHRTNGVKNLDDFMRVLYDEYYKKRDVGFTEANFQEVLNKVAGSSMNDFMSRYVYACETINYAQFFAYAGINLTTEQLAMNSFGLKTASENGKFTITGINRGSSAFLSGLSVGDELLAVNGTRVNNQNDLSFFENSSKSGDKRFKVLYSRDGLVKECTFEVGDFTQMKFTYSIKDNFTESERKVYSKVFVK